MIKNIFREVDIEQLKLIIDEGSFFVLTCHAGPDGDALGSTLGMAHYLKALGKETLVVVPDAYPDFLAWMPDSQEILRFDKYGDKVDGVSWSVIDGSNCKVNDGVVTGESTGKSTVVAAFNGKEYTCLVRVS